MGVGMQGGRRLCGTTATDYYKYSSERRVGGVSITRSIPTEGRKSVSIVRVVGNEE